MRSLREKSCTPALGQAQPSYYKVGVMIPPASWGCGEKHPFRTESSLHTLYNHGKRNILSNGDRAIHSQELILFRSLIHWPSVTPFPVESVPLNFIFQQRSSDFPSGSFSLSCPSLLKDRHSRNWAGQPSTQLREPKKAGESEYGGTQLEPFSL